MLQLHVLPPCGGDTMFSDMFGAYEKLSEPMKTLVDGLGARYESEHIYLGRYADRGKQNDEIDYPATDHPVVRTHPDTGRKALYINRTFTTRINELSDDKVRRCWHFYLIIVSTSISRYAFAGHKTIRLFGIIDAVYIAQSGIIGLRPARAGA